MTTREDWLFRAYTLNEAASRLRNSAAALIEDAKRYEGLAENASNMSRHPEYPQETIRD